MTEKPRSRFKPTGDDFATLEECGRNLCPPEDLHFFLNATPGSVARLLQNYKQAQYAYNRGLAHSRKALRVAHLKLGQTNATMASLLGKTYLGYGQATEADDAEAFDFAAEADRVRQKVFALDPAERIRGNEEEV